jgi:hypothetical protein
LRPLLSTFFHTLGMKLTLTLLLTLTLASLPALYAADPATGITGVTQSPVRLHMPPDAPEGDTVHYGLPQPIQIGPRTAAVFVSRHMHEKGVGDYVNGNDVFVFDSLASLAAAQPLAMDRNDIVPDPVTGEKRVFEKWTGQGGFVPLGALRADGTPHPHAGTGFHFYQSLGYFMKENGAPRPPDPKNPASQPQARTMFYELSYDGKQLRFVDQSLPVGQHLFTEDKRWRISSPSSLRTAIPDGDDLLLAVRGHAKGHYSGVSRWARRAEGWRPVSFQPMPEAERVQEADLARDADGSLLFTFRPADRGPTENYALRVWRSRDGGASWERIVEVPETIGVEPRTVGTATDGSPFVIGNPVQLDRSYFREVLKLWPLDAARNGIEKPLVVRDAPAEFGLSPKNAKFPSNWKLDHPNTAVLRLADGQWHCLLGYRVMRNDILQPGLAPESVHKVCGAYLEEIQSRGPARAVWNFAE